MTLAVRPLIVSALGEVETKNALKLRVFRKETAPKNSERSQANLDLDLKSRVLERLHFPQQAFTRALELSSKYTLHLGIRTTDLLHVAAALELRADSFYSFDLQQRKLAEAVGLALNPV